MTTTTAPTISQERADLLEALATHRYFLTSATEGITQEQARLRTTVSELTLGGLIKHVATTEESWVDFIRNGPGVDSDWNPEAPVDDSWANGFALGEDETLEGALAYYADVARSTAEVVRTVDLDHVWPLPKAPWFAPGATRSVRRALIHIIAETAQHAGHADIIRESLDGKKSMG